MMNTNRPDLPDEPRAMAGQKESPTALGHVATFLHAAVEEFEAAGFTHEEAFSLALQAERFLAEQSTEEQGREERAVGPQLFKSVRPDGTDFCTGKVRWLPAEGVIPAGGWVVEHPKPGPVGAGSARGYLSASSVETDCAGFQWPARLLSVEPVGDVWTPHPEVLPHKRASIRWRVIRELPAWRLFGPQGREVAALIEQAEHLTSTQMDDLTAARWAALDAARWAALDAARWAALAAALNASLNASRVAALDAARYAALDAARDAALAAALGWLVKDLISVEDFRTLTDPWTQIMGPIEVTA